MFTVSFSKFFYDEWLEPLDLSTVELANRLKVSEHDVHNFLTSDHETVFDGLVAEYFDMPADYFTSIREVILRQNAKIVANHQMVACNVEFVTA